MRITETCKALSEESRLRLFHLLSKGYFNVQELTSALDLSQSTISHHLKVLQGSGLVRQHREGTWNYYTLDDAENGLSQSLMESILSQLELSNDKKEQELVSHNLHAAKILLERRQQQSHRFFEEVAPRWNNLRRTAFGLTPDDEPIEYFYQELLAQLRPDECLIELGCGSGTLLEHILPRTGKTIAVDYSPAMIEEAKRSLGARSTTVDFRLGFLEHLPVGDESADKAVAAMVLHHLSSPQDALQDIARVLKPNGSLLILDLMAHADDSMRDKFADVWLGFEPRQVEQWLCNVGFRSTETHVLGMKKKLFLIKTTIEKGE